MQWVVNLQIDLEKLGQLQAQLKVRNQHVNATLWTEKLSTNTLVKKHLSELRKNFEHIGVIVEEIEVYQGLPNHVPSHSLQRQLIDVHT
jgi:flagellar hook-length control protein FliK